MCKDIYSIGGNCVHSWDEKRNSNRELCPAGCCHSVKMLCFLRLCNATCENVFFLETFVPSEKNFFIFMVKHYAKSSAGWGAWFEGDFTICACLALSSCLRHELQCNWLHTCGCAQSLRTPRYPVVVTWCKVWPGEVPERQVRNVRQVSSSVVVKDVTGITQLQEKRNRSSSVILN